MINPKNLILLLEPKDVPADVKVQLEKLLSQNIADLTLKQNMGYTLQECIYIYNATSTSFTLKARVTLSLPGYEQQTLIPIKYTPPRTPLADLPPNLDDN